MRIDAHQHYWRYQPQEYAWISPDMAVLQQDFLPENLRPNLLKQQLDGSIVVQARQTLAETEQILQWSEASGDVGGVVGWIDVTAGDVSDQLQRLHHPRLRGFRHVVQDEVDPAGWLQQSAVARGMQALQQQQYVWDILVTWRHLAPATDFAAQHDKHWLVLDHLGKPDISKGAKVWGQQVAELAAMPHVACKLSGLVTEVVDGQWSRAQLQPFIEEALERFGPQRLMFGSDWPVCLLAAEYQDVAGLVEETVSRLSADEQNRIWGTTAANVYGLTGENHGSVSAK